MCIRDRLLVAHLDLLDLVLLRDILDLVLRLPCLLHLDLRDLVLFLLGVHLERLVLIALDLFLLGGQLLSCIKLLSDSLSISLRSLGSIPAIFSLYLPSFVSVRYSLFKAVFTAFLTFVTATGLPSKNLLT